MGTRFELVIAAGAGDLRAAGEAAVEEIEEWHRRLSRFAPDSLLSHVNRTAAASAVRLDAETFTLVDEALAVWRASGGAFDPTIAPLMATHGFAGSAAGAGDLVDAAAVELDAGAWTIRFTRPGVTLDLGGIAKGHALDQAARVLREAGVTAAVAVTGPSARRADAWATALVVLGTVPAAWPPGYDARFFPVTTS